jgi:prefoldin subunit 5
MAIFAAKEAANGLLATRKPDRQLSRCLGGTVDPMCSGPTLQMKTSVSQAGDACEQEADSVAEQVMSMSEPWGDTVSGPAPAREHMTRPLVQAKPIQNAGARDAAATGTAQNMVPSPGQPLEPATRAFFEPRFMHDFSKVRIHAGVAPTQAARALGARAYTLGSDIVFDQSQYAPGTREGRRLLAHELTHVVQQGHGAAQGAIIQRQETAATALPSASDQQPEEPVESVGDMGRKAVLEAAERRLKEKTTIVSEAEIKDIREGRIRLRLVKLPDGTEVEMNIPTATPVKNFTTCIEFSGQTFGDASKALGKNAKDARRIAALLPRILRIFNQEFNLNAQIEAFQKAILMFDKPLANVRGRQQGFREKKEQLAGQKTGDKLHDKGIDQAIKGQDQAIRQLDSAIAAMEREQRKLEARIGKLQGDYAVLDTQDDALVRATSPLTGHPKPGEYILLGAGAKQAYGVSKETKVSLAKGSFKHIAVFRSSEAAPSPQDKPAEKWEKWHTIDGGGTEARTTELYVCLSDLRVQFADPGKPWASSNTTLIGWLDMDKLLAEGDTAAPQKP